MHGIHGGVSGMTVEGHELASSKIQEDGVRISQAFPELVACALRVYTYVLHA